MIEWSKLCGLGDESAAVELDIDGEELEELKLKIFLKQLKRKELTGPSIAAAAEAIMTRRDSMLTMQAIQQTGSKPRGSRCGPMSFNKEDKLGQGRFGQVFSCEYDGELDVFAVKRIDKLRYESLGGHQEIVALIHAQSTDVGGHQNIIRYKNQVSDDDFVFIIMTLCDETLEQRINAGRLVAMQVRGNEGSTAITNLDPRTPSARHES